VGSVVPSSAEDAHNEDDEDDDEDDDWCPASPTTLFLMVVRVVSVAVTL